MIMAFSLYKPRIYSLFSTITVRLYCSDAVNWHRYKRSQGGVIKRATIFTEHLHTLLAERTEEVLADNHFTGAITTSSIHFSTTQCLLTDTHHKTKERKKKEKQNKEVFFSEAFLPWCLSQGCECRCVTF